MKESGFSSANCPPASRMYCLCKANKESLAVVGVSFGLSSEFFRGENSASLGTSQAANLLKKKFQNLITMYKCTYETAH